MTKDIELISIGITVESLTESLLFYSEYLGMKEGKQHDTKYSKEVPIKSGKIELKLIEFVPKIIPRKTEALNATGEVYLTFTVPDLEKTVNKLSQLGIIFAFPPHLTRSKKHLSTLCKDPDGNRIRLIQEV